MNPFTRNPPFFFIDQNDSTSLHYNVYENVRKIVELSDVGCDARLSIAPRFGRCRQNLPKDTNSLSVDLCYNIRNNEDDRKKFHIGKREDEKKREYLRSFNDNKHVNHAEDTHNMKPKDEELQKKSNVNVVNFKLKNDARDSQNCIIPGDKSHSKNWYALTKDVDNSQSRESVLNLATFYVSTIGVPSKTLLTDHEDPTKYTLKELSEESNQYSFGRSTCIHAENPDKFREVLYDEAYGAETIGNLRFTSYPFGTDSHPTDRWEQSQIFSKQSDEEDAEKGLDTALRESSSTLSELKIDDSVFRLGGRGFDKPTDSVDSNLAEQRRYVTRAVDKDSLSNISRSSVVSLLSESLSSARISLSTSKLPAAEKKSHSTTPYYGTGKNSWSSNAFREFTPPGEKIEYSKIRRRAAEKTEDRTAYWDGEKGRTEIASIVDSKQNARQEEFLIETPMEMLSERNMSHLTPRKIEKFERETGMKRSKNTKKFGCDVLPTDKVTSAIVGKKYSLTSPGDKESKEYPETSFKLKRNKIAELERFNTEPLDKTPLRVAKTTISKETSKKCLLKDGKRSSTSPHSYLKRVKSNGVFGGKKTSTASYSVTTAISEKFKNPKKSSFTVRSHPAERDVCRRKTSDRSNSKISASKPMSVKFRDIKVSKKEGARKECDTRNPNDTINVELKRKLNAEGSESRETLSNAADSRLSMIKGKRTRTESPQSSKIPIRTGSRFTSKIPVATHRNKRTKNISVPRNNNNDSMSLHSDSASQTNYQEKTDISTFFSNDRDSRRSATKPLTKSKVTETSTNEFPNEFSRKQQKIVTDSVNFNKDNNVRENRWRKGERSDETRDQTRSILWSEKLEEAYAKGRAVGLKVLNMARTAREKRKREFAKHGFGMYKEIPSNRPQEILDIGVAVVEQMLERENSQCFTNVESNPIDVDDCLFKHCSSFPSYDVPVKRRMVSKGYF